MGNEMKEQSPSPEPSNLPPGMPSFVYDVEKGANLVIYGRSRTGKSTILRKWFPNRRVQYHRPNPDCTDEPFIWETQEDASHMAFWGFTRDVHLWDFGPLVEPSQYEHLVFEGRMQ